MQIPIIKTSTFAYDRVKPREPVSRWLVTTYGSESTSSNRRVSLRSAIHMTRFLTGNFFFTFPFGDTPRAHRELTDTYLNKWQATERLGSFVWSLITSQKAIANRGNFILRLTRAWPVRASFKSCPIADRRVICLWITLPENNALRG
jgi:hypothetical protein